MTPTPSSLPVPDLDWFQEIVKGAPDPIIIIDLKGNILFHNDQTDGEDPAIFIGQPIFNYFLPEFHQVVRATINKAIQTGQAQTYELASLIGGTDKHWYMTRVGPILREGRVVALVLFIREITELKGVQQALSEMNEALEQRVAERTLALNAYAKRLEASEQLNAELRQAKTRQKALEILAGHSLNVLGADLVGVYQIQDGNLCLSFSLEHTETPPTCLSPKQDHFLYRMLQANKIRFVQLGEYPEPGCEFCSFAHSQKMHGLLIAPLRTGDTVVGLLYLGWHIPRPITPGDEQLLSAFVESGSNTLQRIRVTEQLEQNIRQREHELRVLYEITSIASQVLDTEETLKKSLNVTLPAVNCCTGVIHLADAKQEKLKVGVSENCPDSLYTWLQLSGSAQALWEEVYRKGQIVEVRHLQTQSYHETAGPGVRVLTYLGVPIRAQEMTVGVLSLFSESEGLIEPDVKQMVGTIADQIGLGLETTQQRQLEKEALILEERQRLARELHDSVSQSLYGLVLSADVCNKLLQLKAYGKLSETLVNIGDVAHQSLKEMRLMLFELRPLSLETVGLVGALDLRLNTVERRANMLTTLDVTGSEFIPRRLELEMYRIASEALNNSLKHARASAVRVSLSATPEVLELVIADNGKGFDMTRKQSGGLGLSSMQERASRIGGELTVDSVSQVGTRVYLTVPLCKETSSRQEAARQQEQAGRQDQEQELA